MKKYSNEKTYIIMLRHITTDYMRFINFYIKNIMNYKKLCTIMSTA